MPDPEATVSVRHLKDIRRRAYVRHVLPSTPNATVLAPDHADAAYVVNVSAGGVALLLRRRLPPATTVLVELVGWPEELAKHPARVAHNTRQAAGDWLVGLEFERRLPEEELRQLLAGPVLAL